MTISKHSETDNVVVMSRRLDGMHGILVQRRDIDGIVLSHYMEHGLNRVRRHGSDRAIRDHQLHGQLKIT